MVEIKCTLCGKTQKANPDFMPRYLKCGHHGDHAKVVENKDRKMSSSKPIRTDRLYSLLAQRPAVMAYVNEREAFVKELAIRLATPEDLTTAYDQLLALDLNDNDLRDAAILLRDAAAIAG